MLSLKTATVHDDYAWVWEGDEAIDQGRKDWQAELKAALESNNLDRLPLKQNVKPTVFWLRHTTPVMRRYFEALRSKDDGWSLGLRRVVELSVVRAENTGIPLEWESVDTGTGMPCVPSETMDILDRVEKGALVNAIALHVLTGINDPS